ncbi:hypothetical protein AGLY_013592 [Aphis glycines]|uniref:DRBM domain-containing protein n=1 Tax=Aphis glycines TaxID=307491 RepID=A0A6G0T6S2_APHGL|nr:hypothetical protein AGLY_013592 [Aphis glycines]
MIICNSYWNRYKTRKKVETFNQLFSTTQQPPSSPTPPPPSPPSPSPSPTPPPLLLQQQPPSTLQQQQPPLSPPLQQKHQLTEPLVENCVTILTGDTIVIAEKTTRCQVSPKSPLMIFNELVKNTKIQLQEHRGGASNHITSYTAMFEIGGKTYIGNHISKQQAKQKACESYLMTIFKDQIKNNKGSPEMEVVENIRESKTKTPHQKDFPWSQFASLQVMRNYINQRELQEHQGGASKHTTGYTAMFEIGGKTYIGNDVSKKQAKQKACKSYLMTIFKDQIKKYKGSPEMEVGENTRESKTKIPHQKDFPWSQFASLQVMRNYINQWEVEPVVTRA